MFYQIVRGIARIIFWFLGLKSSGLHNLPMKGPLIVAANHVSNWDPIVVAVTVNRPIHFMAKAELFKWPWFAWFFRGLNAFPIHRKAGDRAAIRHSMAILEQQEVLGIFPEGFRNRSGEYKAQTGAALIAMKTGAPVLPVACVGTQRSIPLGWFTPLEVKIGPPIDVTEYVGQKVTSATLEQISERVMYEIEVLLRK